VAIGEAAASAADAAWVSVGPPGGAVLRVAAAPSDAQRAYLSGPSSGVLRSLDGGVTWQPASAGMTNLDVRSLAVSPVDAGIVLAGTNGGAFRTTDGASHWVAVSGTLPADAIDGVAFDPSGATAYAVSSSGWIGKSTDAGVSWQTLSSAASGQRPQCVTVDPTNAARIYVGTLDNGIYRSDNGGASWTEWMAREIPGRP
jgi:photosystem II stability/assembly factor-like uncharacterized protein